MGDRAASGDDGLDLILGGGLPTNGINLIMGLPGSGKTLLCQQFMFARATEERPAIYLSTVSEPFDKILRYAQTLSFFDREAVGRSVFYEDLGPTVAGEHGLAAVTERVAELIKERRPGIIAIDSFKALAAFADDARAFRRFLHELAALLTAFPATCFWIGEYSEEETRSAPEFAVADGIISLATERAGERTLRLIQVTKLRGSDFRSGRHAYRLSGDGITVFPRLSDPARDDDYRLSEARISSGIEPLDRMLAEGYTPGSSTLVAGPSGAGKTLMALHFIFSGAANGEPGVIASLQENPIQLERIARGFGWSLENERVDVMHRSPNDVYIDEWVYELLDLIETTGATRVMIDSLSDLSHATPDPVRFREFVYSLTQRLSRAGISPLMTSEIPDLFHVGRLAEYGISHLSDNVLLLQYLRAESRLLRTVTILKSRASAHDPEIREFEITPDGIVLGDPIAGEQI
ncbi:MAG TPA: ATPase domain-containing protein [Solirubrobacteraceae bacterium]|nr:ATPase domain-containing protein [Solirubrobacteraceae bacterium]